MRMNIKKTFALISASLVVAGIGTIATQCGANAQVSVPPMHRVHAERHPDMVRALQQLNAARASLQTGAHDFGGHRLHALALVNQAIDQVQQALASDRH